jgi:hypothetical protein
MDTSNPNLIAWAGREVGDQFSTYKFSYGADAAGNVWDRAEALAAARGSKEITLADWNAAALAEESVAEREAIRAAEKASYHAALEAARRRSEAVEVQPGVSVLPSGSVRFSAEWILANAEPVN